MVTISIRVDIIIGGTHFLGAVFSARLIRFHSHSHETEDACVQFEAVLIVIIVTIVIIVIIFVIDLGGVTGGVVHDDKIVNHQSIDDDSHSFTPV